MDGAVRSVAELPGETWRNGAGVTRAVAADGDGAEPAWRISIATVTDGAAFSSFTGYNRTFLPLGTDRITLFDADGPLPADDDSSVRFDGGAVVSARVNGGEALALNVMTLAGLGARLRRRIVTGPVAGSDPGLRATVVTQGSVTDPTGRTVHAPAVMEPGATVTADGAHLLDIFIGIAPTPTTRTSG